jgi:hypothetical protein
MSKNPLLHTLIQMTGQDNVITVHRPFVQFTGSLEAAMMLSQLLYWTPKSSMGGWIAKSDKEWNDELCLSRYGIRTATTTLKDMGVIETKLKKFNGAPTNHYIVQWDALEKKWVDWLESKNGLSEIKQSDCTESDNSLSEKGQSLTETTTETTKRLTQAERMQQALERKAKQQAKRGDPVDFLLEQGKGQQEIIDMRLRVEGALKMNLEREWDLPKSDWNDYDKLLVRREKETGQTIERFMSWFEADDFRKKSSVWLKPSKIEQWWPQAFSGHTPGVDPSAEDFPTL